MGTKTRLIFRCFRGVSHVTGTLLEMESPKLIYDVGMHCGEDTEYYLSRGCRVVGIEANPELVNQLREKFSAEISRGQLQIIAKAIAAKAGRVRFAINRDISVWGSISTDYI